MITKYSDHSANERTYLAWIRTAIAIMAFGFLIEKFELFIVNLGNILGSSKTIQPSLAVELVGLGLFAIGILIIITATVRFFMHKKAIESEKITQYNVRKIQVTISILMLLISLFLVVYLFHQIIN